MPAEKITEFETLMREYENDVLRLCFVYLGNLQLAEDAMQDSFLKVWRSMDGFEGATRPPSRHGYSASPSIPAKTIGVATGIAVWTYRRPWRIFRSPKMQRTICFCWM